MGIDIMDLTFRLEREFGVKFDRAPLDQFYQEDGVWDIRVRDFVHWARQNVERHEPRSEIDDAEFFRRVRRHIIECLAIDESEVTPQAWLVRNLGLE